jgi:hypothetical protein
LGYANAETTSGEAAEATEKDIASEDDSWINGVLGIAGTVGGDLAGGWAKAGFPTGDGGGGGGGSEDNPLNPFG